MEKGAVPWKRGCAIALQRQGNSIGKRIAWFCRFWAWVLYGFCGVGSFLVGSLMLQVSCVFFLGSGCLFVGLCCLVPRLFALLVCLVCSCFGLQSSMGLSYKQPQNTHTLTVKHTPPQQLLTPTLNRLLTTTVVSINAAHFSVRIAVQSL